MIRRPGTSVVKASKSPPAGIAGAAIRRMKGNGQGDSFTGSFFPPGSPLPTQAPRSVAGRRFDYPQGVNLTYTPRQQSGQENVTFDLLRRFAEPTRGGLDIVRLLIERRKKQMKAQTFKIVGREKDDDGGQRARDIEAMFRKPDGTHSWRGWLSGVLEDHFVIDAVAIYPRWSGARPVFDQIDGALIDLLVDDGGRRPVPPLPAYQQILKGLPAVNYTTDELAYYIENPRPQKIYGFSPVEQMIGIITIALNRQLSILNYFTSGSVPDMLVGVPETWNPDQISQFQEWWDSVLAGQLDERRHARFIPGGTKPIETKEKVLMGEFDEWIARVACFCFGISPQAFVKEMNRATAETSKSSAAEEGLEPTKMFVKDVMDDLLSRCGAEDLQLVWEDEEVQDPKTKAEIAVMLRGGTTGSAKPVITLEEQREMMGFKPPTAEQIDELDPPEPDPMVGPDGQPLKGGLPAGGPVKTVPAPDAAVKKAAASRGGRSLPAVKKNRKLAQRVEKGITAVAKRVLVRQRKAMTATLRARSEKLQKVDNEDIRQLLAELAANGWNADDVARLTELLRMMAADRARASLDQVGDFINIDDAGYADLLEQANEKAVAWAEARAGNLITQLDETSKDIINQMTASALADGLTNAELADSLEESFGFSAERAMMIARTETAVSDSQGTLIGFRESGVVNGKEWFPDADACPICLENADDGVIGLDDVFSSGDDAPPGHPNCECTLLPVLDESLIDAMRDDGAVDIAAD